MNKANNADKPTVASRTIRINLTSEQHRDLRVCAVVAGRTITAILTEAALDFIAQSCGNYSPAQNKSAQDTK